MDDVLRRAEGLVNKGGGCWGWLGTIRVDGYPVIYVRKGWQTNPVRLFWARDNGEAAPRQLWNICGDKACVNPAHWDQKNADADKRPVKNEAALCAQHDGMARQAAMWAWRKYRLRRFFELDDVMGQARLCLLVEIRSLDGAELDNGKVLYWRTRWALQHWIDQVSHDNRAWSRLDARSLSHEDDLGWYEVRDLTFRSPELAALDRCFRDDLQWALAALNPQQREAIGIGAYRNGENAVEAAHRLGMSKSLLCKRRATADRTLIGLLQSRGWLTGPDEDVA